MLKKLLCNFLGFIPPFVHVLKFIRDCMLVFLIIPVQITLSVSNFRPFLLQENL